MESSRLSEFSAALRQLGHRLGKRDVDTETVSEAFADLQSFPWPVVTAALETLRKTSRFFPRPQQLIDACHEASRAYHARAVLTPLDVQHATGRYACDICEDTGFERRLACPGTGVCHVGRCGQENQPNEPHAFTRRCVCRPTNPVLARERAMMPRPSGTERT